MKAQKIILATAIWVFSALSASAYDFMVDGICYNVIYETNNVFVTYDYGSDPYEGDVVIPETVSWEGNVYQVTTIGHGAFSSREITSLTIPASVIAIDRTAFQGTKKLISIDVDKNNPSFSSSDGILFDKEKTNLVIYPAGKTETTYMIPNSVTVIGGYAFSSCQNLTSVTLPESLTFIGSYAFYACSSLVSITLPESITTIESSTFHSCSNLVSITLPESITSFESWAFCRCSKLVSLTLPKSLTFIEYRAFIGCSGLLSIEVDDNHTHFSAIDGVLYNKDKTSLILYPAAKEESAFVIPNSVKTIEGYAFYGCSNLKEIEFPHSLDTIGYASFEHSRIISMTIPASVEYIDAWAFTKCGLKSIIFEGAVKYVGFNFLADTQFSEIEVKSKPFEIANSLGHVYFENKTLIVPNGMKDLYLAAPGWQNFGTILEKSQVVSVTNIIQQPDHIYPNPTTGMVYSETASDIKVYDSQGTLLRSTFGTQVDLSAYPKGLYLLQKNGKTYKIIKQ